MPSSVLAPDFWKREFASDPAVVGRTIRLNGTAFTVIGVAPESFPGMPIFRVPTSTCRSRWRAVFSTDPQKNFFDGPGRSRVDREARLKPGTTLRQARNELAVLATDFRARVPEAQSRPRRGGAHAVRDADARRRLELEVRRDLHDPRAGRCCWWRAPTPRDFF